jgi:hypothetical protein
MTNMHAKINVTTGTSLANTTLTSGIPINSVYASSITTTTGGSISPWNYSTTGGYASTGYSNTVFATSIKVEGNADFDQDVKIKGVSVSERLDAIEARLAILRPDPELADKWEKLKILGDEYRRVEKEIIEGEQVWNILNR